MEVGAWQMVDPTSQSIKNLAQFAIEQRNLSITGAKLMSPRVLAAKQQVVSGVKYLLKIEASVAKQKNQYEAVILTRDWEHFRSLESFKPLKSLPGGLYNVDPTMFDIQNLAKFALSEHNAKLAGEKLEYSKVLEARAQVVAGMQYVLVIEVHIGTKLKQYQAIIWQKGWENYTALMSFTPLPFTPLPSL